MKKGFRVVKNLFFIILVVLLASCEKECNCGIIKDDGVEIESGTFNSFYWVTIENSCSNNIKKFYLSQGDWYNAHVGSYYCISTVTSW